MRIILKKYWMYIVFIIICILSFVGVYYYSYNEKNNNVKEVKQVITRKSVDNNEEKTKTVFVDVKGAVNKPGVYEIEENKRVMDAINLAGGLSNNANTINLNLSKKVTDEMYIIIYTKNEILNYKKNNSNGEITCASNECVCPDSSNDACIKKEDANKSENKVNGKVSINSASKEELMTLSGVGEAKADAIISYRQNNGNFKSLEDIKNVSGIGDALYEKIKDNITL